MPNGNGDTLPINLRGWAVLALLTLAASAITFVVRTETRLAAIEANRYTSADQAQHLRDIDRRFREEVPPPEVLRRLADLERRMERAEHAERS